MSGPKYGTNAGKLYYDTTSDQSDSRFTKGYGAHVIIGREYTIDFPKSKNDIFIEVSDPILAEKLQESADDEYVMLNLRLNGHVRSCRLSAMESRLFHSAEGISKGAELGECTLAFRAVVEDASGTEWSTTTTIAPTPIPDDFECNCGEFDPACLHGGLGCNACGEKFCRYCGSDGWLDCPETTPGPTTTTKEGDTPKSTTTTTKTTTTEKTIAPPPNGCCNGAEFEPACSGHDQYGGLGCNACGEWNCRFCGHHDWPPCPQH